ncbi:MAG: dynamin family protein [Verrucomicrobia bacterium]|nr:dynamin family protein [Verrucomicrobiota bacterium]
MKTLEKTAKRAAVNIKALSYQMERLAQLEAKIRNGPADQDFLANAKLTGLGIFRLVVMGEIKKGKSSFINALTGTENLVPVHSDVATSTIFKIHYGPKIKYTVYFNKDEKGSARDKLPIEAAQVNEYGTEDGNPENIKNVDFIRVESPASILQNGLVIVDTPGVGGLFKKHREITFRHAPNSDAVFFITDSVESPIGADEVKFLRELRQITPLITFIQTKSSKADAPARKARMENNLGILKEGVGISKEEIAYFIVDSKTKLEADRNRDTRDLEDSGFGPLMSYLNNTLRKNQESNVAKAALRRAMSKLLPLETELSRRRGILEADTNEKRANLDHEISELQTRLAEWERTSKPRIVEEFRKGVTSLTREAQEELRPLQAGGVIQSEFEQEIEKAENAEQVKILMTQVHSDLAALTSAVCIKISEKARNGVTTLLESLTKDVIGTMEGRHELSLASIDPDKLWVNTGAIGRVINRESNDSLYITGRNAFGGITMGAGAAYLAGMILGTLIAPGLGTIVGGPFVGLVAAAWGGKMAVESASNQKLEAYKRECYGALQQALGSAHQSALSQVNILIADMQAEATSLLQKMMQQANDNLLKTRSDLNRRQKATQQEIQQGQKNVAGLAMELDTIKKALESFHKTLSV